MTETQTRLEEIRERCEKASKGPWKWDYLYLKDSKEANVLCDDLYGGPRDPCDDTLDGASWINHIFIAHARQDIPWLLELVDELRMNAAAVVDYHKGWDLQAKQERVFVSLELLTNLRDTLAKLK